MMTRTPNAMAAGALAIVAMTVFTIGGMPAFAGAQDGPKDVRDTVKKGYKDVYHVTFNGDERAHVEAMADGLVEIYVYDENGDLVIKDTTDDNHPKVEWKPDHQQVYTIKLANTEDTDLHYHLKTN